MAPTPATTFQELVVWQKSHALVLRVYKETQSFPKQELFGLVAQRRRAAISVPANIAEAFKKRGRPEKARLMNIAQGSLEELRYYTILSRDLGYVSSGSEWGEIEEIARMLGAYTRTLLIPKS